MTTLTRHQREALDMLKARGCIEPDGTAVVTSDATWADPHNVWINYRTAYALRRKGLVEIEVFGLDGADVFLKVEEVALP